MSPGLPFVEILASLLSPVIELSSITTLVLMAAPPSILDYHLGTSPIYEEDPLEETSITVSHVADVVGPNHARRVEVLSKHPRIIHTPFVPRGQGARGRSRSGLRNS